MRIAVVAPNIQLPGTNGGATHVTELVKALRRQNEVRVIGRRGSTAEGVAAIGLGSGDGWAGVGLAALHYPASFAALRAFRPQAIYERFSASGLGVMLGRTFRVPVVSMILDPNVCSITLRGADRLITTSLDLIPPLLRPKAIKVNWGANAEHFCPAPRDEALREQLGFRPNQCVFVYAGAFYPWHGLEDLVDAMQQLPAPHRDCARLLLVGDGQLRGSIEARVLAAGLQDQIRLVGRVPYTDVPRYLRSADVAVAPYNPSKHPGLRNRGMYFDPLKVFESLACGLPTITLNSDNIRGMFAHGEHAWLVPPGSPTHLADAMVHLMDRPDLRLGLGERGCALVRKQYSWQAHGEMLTALFEQLVRE